MMVTCTVCGMLVEPAHAETHAREQAFVRLAKANEKVALARIALETAYIELARLATHTPPPVNDDEREAHARACELFLARGT